MDRSLLSAALFANDLVIHVNLSRMAGSPVSLPDKIKLEVCVDSFESAIASVYFTHASNIVPTLPLPYAG